MQSPCRSSLPTARPGFRNACGYPSPFWIDIHAIQSQHPVASPDTNALSSPYCPRRLAAWYARRSRGCDGPWFNVARSLRATWLEQRLQRLKTRATHVHDPESPRSLPIFPSLPTWSQSWSAAQQPLPTATNKRLHPSRATKLPSDDVFSRPASPAASANPRCVSLAWHDLPVPRGKQETGCQFACADRPCRDPGLTESVGC